MAQLKRPGKARGQLWSEYSGLVAAVALMGTVLGFLSWSGYKDATENARLETQAAAHLIASNLDTSLNVADIVLAQVATEASSHMSDRAALATFWSAEAGRLKAYLDRVPDIHSLHVWGADGALLHSTDNTTRAISVADRQHFRLVRENPQGGMVISEVLVSRFTGEASIVLARPITDAQGRFLGEVTVPLKLAAIERLLGEISLGEKHSAALRRSEGGLLVARHPPSPESVNKPDKSNVAQDRILAGETGGTVRYAASIDNIDRIVSFQKLTRYPLYVIVGSAMDDILALWQRRTAAAFLLVCLAFSAVMLAYRRQANATAQLRERERFLSTLFEASSVAIFLTDRQQRITHANQRMATLFHAPLETLTTLPYRNLLDPDVRDSVDENGRRLITGEVDFLDVERHYVRRDGSHFWGHLSARRLLGADGRFEGIVGMIADISGRREAQASLERTNRLLQDMLDAATEIAIISADLKGAITVFNRGAERMLGYTAQEAIESLTPLRIHTYAEIEQRRLELAGQIPPDAEPFRVLTAIVDRDGVDQRDCDWVRKDSSLLSVALTLNLMRGADGQPIGYLAIAQDITERRQSRLELERYRDQLEALVAERTRQIETLNHQLEIRAIEAEAANRAKSTFLANMSHEIRTPMNAILGFTHLLGRDIRSGPALDKLAKIGDAGAHLLQVINDILDFSKIEAGKLSLEPVEFDLDTVLRAVCAMVGVRAQAKGLELVLEVDPALTLDTRLYGDPTRLQQALLNYAANAVKFTEHGSVVLRAQVAEAGDDDLLVRFEVQDSGPGIAPEALSRLFAAFEQADSSTARRFGGTGLGLAISSRLAQIMGGKAGVTSEPGQGSTFWLTARLGRRAKPAETPAGQLSGKRIVLIDPQPDSRAAITAVLAQLGLQVEDYESVEAARTALHAAAGAKHIDAVLVDRLAIGAIDRTAIGRLGLPALPAACYVFLLVPEGQCSASEAAAAGFAGVLGKPLTASAALDTFAAALCPGNAAPEFDDVICDEERQLRHRHGGAPVLLVEDNEFNQIVAQELLETAGLKVDLAVNGREALDKVRGNAYALVLMDMQMPEMDGIEATTHIRAMPDRHSLPIIAMTANAFDEDRRRCLDAGMNDHIAKPTVPQELFATLLRWLDRRGA